MPSVTWSALSSSSRRSRRLSGVVGSDFQAHHLRKPSVVDLLLDQAQEVVRLLRLDVHVGVPGDPEAVRAEDLDPREERLEVRHDEALEEDVPVRSRAAAPSAAGCGEP